MIMSTLQFLQAVCLVLLRVELLLRLHIGVLQCRLSDLLYNLRYIDSLCSITGVKTSYRWVSFADECRQARAHSIATSRLIGGQGL